MLIPRRPGLVELTELTPADWALLPWELEAAARAVRAVGAVLDLPVDKLNVGALGNIVPQLHLHVLGRRVGDPAWPGPVWGHGAPEAYGDEGLARATAAAMAVLA